MYLGRGQSGHQPKSHCNRVPLQLLAADNKHYLQGERQHQEGEQAHTDLTPPHRTLVLQEQTAMARELGQV